LKHGIIGAVINTSRFHSVPLEPKSTLAPIRVALVEDDVHFQQAVRRSIEVAEDMELISVADSLEAGLSLLRGPQAGVLLVDLGLPDGSGIDVIRAAQVSWPECEVMVCTTLDDDAHVMRSIEAGASGYLLKDSTPEDILDEIRSVFSGGSPISPFIARRILTRFRETSSPTASQPQDAEANASQALLSLREREALELLTRGFTAEEIAGLMGISRHTVLTYVRRIYGKLKVNSRTEAIYEARQRGLLAG
jgi:DNA-binding NarL/FixJ family response regulator